MISFYADRDIMSNRYRGIIRMKRYISAIAALALFIAPQAFAKIDITQPLLNPALNLEKTSIAIADATTGKMIGGHQADQQLNPASCMKIITSAAAFTMLGTDYHLSTDFYTDEMPERSGAIGTLYIYGSGDPMISNEDLARMAADLHSRGVNRITKGVVVDDSFFDSPYFPKKGGRNNVSAISSLPINLNTMAVIVDPSPDGKNRIEITLDPPVDNIKIVNKVTYGKRFAVKVVPSKLGDQEILTVTGQISKKSGPQKYFRGVIDTALFAGFAFKHYFEKAGISIEGGVRKGAVPSGAYKIVSEPSKGLSEILTEMNKHSNNFIAEMMLKHLGAAKYGVPGSTEKGVRALQDYLSSIGIPQQSITLENGSGLSDKTRISAKDLVSVLTAAFNNFKIRDDFIKSLSVLGFDGTTRRWGFSRELGGAAYVKTGTLNGVSALAGFAPSANGKTVAFAILANGLQHGADAAHRAQVDIVKIISESQLW